MTIKLEILIAAAFNSTAIYDLEPATSTEQVVVNKTDRNDTKLVSNSRGSKAKHSDDYRSLNTSTDLYVELKHQ